MAAHALKMLDGELVEDGEEAGDGEADEPGADADADAIPVDLAEHVAHLAAIDEYLRENDPEAVELAEAFAAEVNPPAWAADEPIWQRAKEAAGLGASWALVRHVYKHMGGTIG